jgi:hypothetical protein
MSPLVLADSSIARLTQRVSALPIGHNVNRQSQTKHMDAVTKLIAEGHALTRALAVIEDGASVDEARRCCSSYFDHHVTDSLENCVIDCALRKICRLPATTYSIPHVDDLEDVGAYLFQSGAHSWMEWARVGMTTDLPDGLRPLGAAAHHSLEAVRSALDVMALTNWVAAVDNLRRGDLQAGRRYFRRATVLGGEYGTVSNPVIQWTYAASFFPQAVID